MPKCHLPQLGRSILGICAVLLTLNVAAAPIQLAPGTVNMFRDSRGANNIGISQGDRLQYGAGVLGGSLGTTLGASYPPTGFTDPQEPWSLRGEPELLWELDGVCDQSNCAALVLALPAAERGACRRRGALIGRYGSRGAIPG